MSICVRERLFKNSFQNIQSLCNLLNYIISICSFLRSFSSFLKVCPFIISCLLFDLFVFVLIVHSSLSLCVFIYCIQQFHFRNVPFFCCLPCFSTDLFFCFLSASSQNWCCSPNISIYNWILCFFTVFECLQVILLLGFLGSQHQVSWMILSMTSFWALVLAWLCKDCGHWSHLLLWNLNARTSIRDDWN